MQTNEAVQEHAMKTTPHRQALRMVLAYARRHFESYSNSARGAVRTDRKAFLYWCEKAHDWGAIMATVATWLKIADRAVDEGRFDLNRADVAMDDVGDVLMSLEAECARLRGMLEVRLS